MLSADFVSSLGRDLNFRPRVNQRIPGSLSNPVLAGGDHPDDQPELECQPPAVSRGESDYKAITFSGRRRLSHGIDFGASYTLQKGLSTIGAAADELNTANIQIRTTRSTIRGSSART